jgi:hypothetical protein
MIINYERLKTNYKFIRFRRAENLFHRPGESGFDVLNYKSQNPIGDISYYAEWKKWVFMSRNMCVFSIGCLRDIADFMGQLPKG